MEKLLCILILAIIAFMLWYLIGRCSCTILNGFRVGASSYNLKEYFKRKVNNIVKHENSLRHLPLSYLWRDLDMLNCMDEKVQKVDAIYGTGGHLIGKVIKKLKIFLKQR